MEKHELEPNHENLSKCCGPNCLFERLYIEAELNDNKVHAKKPDDEIIVDNLLEIILKVISAHTYSKIPQPVLMAF